MKNNQFKILFFIFLICFNNSYSITEDFNFNVTEVEILENGNKFYGKKVDNSNS